MLLLLTACIENGLFGRKDVEVEVFVDPAPVDDTGDPPPQEECNGVDDDGDGEVDEGFPDDDGNGRPDCLDGVCALEAQPAGRCDQGASCSVIDPIPDAWAVRQLWTFAGPSAAPDAALSVTQPLIVQLQDDNGDGAVDAGDAMDVVTAVYDPDGHGWLLALDGATGAEHWAIPGVRADTQIAAADLDDDGFIEIVAYVEDGHAVAFNAAGVLAWTSSEAAAPAEDGWQVLVADLEGDGSAEVIADTMILNGQTGTLRASLTVDTVTHQHRLPYVGDIDGDGQQEILMAGRVFDADGVEIWYSGEGVEDGVWAALGQLDTDDDAEVITLGANLVLSDSEGTTLIRSPTFARNWSGGPCVGDFDGDGAPEFGYGAYDGLYVRDMDVRNVWYAPIDVANYAGQAACVGYDLDRDGALELLYADEHAFRIYDGRDGTVLFEDNANYQSVALYASPAVGDLDGDGDVEIVVVVSDGTLGHSVIAYTHDGEGWPAVTTTWPVFDFDGWNIAADGSVPEFPAASWLNGNGVRTTPVNPRYTDGADLVVSIDDVCIWDCTYGPVQVSVQVRNQGVVTAPAGTMLDLFAIDGEDRRLVASLSLGEVLAGAVLEGVIFDLAAADVGTDGFAAILDGTGIVAECDETNNEALWEEGCVPPS